MNKGYWILKGLKMAVFAIVAITLVGMVTMQLWNWLIPVLFKGPVINLCQTYGLIILGKILFGGFGGRRGHGWGGHYRQNAWKEKMQAKMASMTPEQREKMRSKFNRHCGGRWDWKEDEPVAKAE